MTRFEKWSVLTGSALTLATGTGYFWTKYLVRPADPWAVVNHPLQTFFLKSHILVAPLLVFAVGMVAVRHVWKHFVSGIQWARRSGLTTAASLLPMVVTGYLIQAVTGEALLQGIAISHIVLGFLFAVGLTIHYVTVRRPPARGRMVRQTRRIHRAPLVGGQHTRPRRSVS